MFQPCLSWKTENPCKFFIYKGLSSSSCTQTRDMSFCLIGCYIVINDVNLLI